MNRIELFRWLALIPVTFIVTGISTGLFAYTLLEIIKPFSTGSESDALYSGMLTSFAAVVWLLTTYFIAPKHKKIVLWLSYIIGCFISGAILLEINSRSELAFFTSFFLTALIGFVIAIILHFGKNILNEIER